MNYEPKYITLKKIIEYCPYLHLVSHQLDDYLRRNVT